MKITNKHGVPDVIWRAAQNDKYSRGLADISVTQLIDAPQIAVLRERHVEELESDVVDRMWSLLGTAVHSLLEHASEGALVEERLFCKAGGLTISGAIDVQEEEEDGSISIMDFKVTGAASVQYGKDSWHNQLNCYAYLVRKNKGKPVKRLQICAILRDWKKSEMLRDSRYPKSPIILVEIPVWSDARQDGYIETRAQLHYAARQGDPVPCTQVDRWERNERWAVLKTPKAKRALRNYQSEAEAIAAADGKYIVQHRPGTCVRCEQDFCGVAKWCQQWKEIQDDSGLFNTEHSSDPGLDQSQPNHKPKPDTDDLFF